MNNNSKRYQIHCYKHNGKIHSTSNEVDILDETDDMLVCANYKALVTESDGRSYKTKEPAIIFFYKKNWFNVIAQFKSFGLYYYCNIATPFIIDENAIKYIDYDLDLRVFPDGSYRILDNNEYKYHKKVMHYPEELELIVKKELEKLINMKKNNEGPFDKNVVNKYFEKYSKMIHI